MEQNQKTCNPAKISTEVSAGDVICCHGWWYYVDRVSSMTYDVSFSLRDGRTVCSLVHLHRTADITDRIPGPMNRIDGHRLVRVMDRL